MALSDYDVGAAINSFNGTVDDSPIILVATGPRLLYGWAFIATTDVLSYLQVFDAAAIGDVTLGNTVPKIAIPAAKSTLMVPAVCSLAKPISFSKGICIASTTTATGSITGPTTVNIFYA